MKTAFELELAGELGYHLPEPGVADPEHGDEVESSGLVPVDAVVQIQEPQGWGELLELRVGDGLVEFDCGHFSVPPFQFSCCHVVMREPDISGLAASPLAEHSAPGGFLLTDVLQVYVLLVRHGVVSSFLKML